MADTRRESHRFAQYTRCSVGRGLRRVQLASPRMATPRPFRPARRLLYPSVQSQPEVDVDYEMELEREFMLRRAPSPGIAAVLSVLAPGLGQVYTGRLLAGGIWFLATAFAYSAVLLPGFLVHALCVWSAYRSAWTWVRY